VDELLDHLWDLPLVLGTEAWDEWESKHPALVGAGLGDNLPHEFEAFLQAHGVAIGEFRELLESTVEIAFGSFYAAADDTESLGYLQKVVRIVRLHGIEPPPVDLFSPSRFNDRHGWGDKLSETERKAWRSLADDNAP
jgi:hypothetical protein